YRIVKTLGKGGMGGVYLAEDPKLDRLVAIKVPFFDSEDQQSVVDRFRREAKLAAAIQHPNICPIYDVADVDGAPFLAMAYIEGKPLSAMIRPEKPLAVRTVLLLVRKLALALQEAHSKGVVHRDLKPANIMIDHRREPIIMDFGLARRDRQGEQQLTRTGQLVGTPRYMAPEQVAGRPDAIGPGCDIYALGVILYELLTGRPPFSGDLLAVLSQIAIAEPEPPSSLRPELDAELDHICARAMAKQVEDRFGSMAEMAERLTELIRSSASQGAAAGATSSGLQAVQTKPPAAPMPPLSSVKPPPVSLPPQPAARKPAAAPAAVLQIDTQPRRSTPQPVRRKSVPIYVWAISGIGLVVVVAAAVGVVAWATSQNGREGAGVRSAEKPTPAEDTPTEKSLPGADAPLAPTPPANARFSATLTNVPLKLIMRSRQLKHLKFEYDEAELGIILNQTIDASVDDQTIEQFVHDIFDKVGVDASFNGNTVTLTPKAKTGGTGGKSPGRGGVRKRPGRGGGGGGGFSGGGRRKPAPKNADD
ncbi:MAG: protein kinase, partial [Planctomycetes bacterium]|nr:protein kinase [Planctomycetota bacterium]